MNANEVKELRMELDYGIVYAVKSLEMIDSANVQAGIERLIESKMILGKVFIYAGGPNRNINSSDPRNLVIEPATDKVEAGSVIVHENYNTVQNLKFIVKGLEMAKGKVVDFRMSRSEVTNPKYQYMAMRGLDHTIDCLESAIGFFLMELIKISDENPGLYPSNDDGINQQEDVNKSEDVATTDSLMEERAKEYRSPEETLHTPYTGADYLPGGRMYKPKVEEAPIEEMPQGPGPEPAPENNEEDNSLTTNEEE